MSPTVIITSHDLSWCLQASVRTNSLCAFCPGPGEQRHHINRDRQRKTMRERERERMRERGGGKRGVERASAAALHIVFLVFYLSAMWFFVDNMNIKLFFLFSFLFYVRRQCWSYVTELFVLKLPERFGCGLESQYEKQEQTKPSFAWQLWANSSPELNIITLWAWQFRLIFSGGLIISSVLKSGFFHAHYIE